MFSQAQKQHIAEVIEKTLLELNHPEMPNACPTFHLRVDGSESWSYADISPNWTFDQNYPPTTTPFNERVEGEDS